MADLGEIEDALGVLMEAGTELEKSQFCIAIPSIQHRWKGPC